MSQYSGQKDQPLILVVDDDKSMQMLVCKAMEKEGYLVAKASDGQECLAVYQQLRPDMILLDALMPVMDGFTCCAQLQTLPQGDRTPVLMITALEDQESVDRAFKVGAIDYITKPIHWAVLRQRVRRLLQASRAERNVTECQRVEAEIRSALVKEQELSLLKSRFVTMTSHEFRTPLTTILSSAELLQDYGSKWTEEKKLQHFQRIQTAVKHMTGMLDDVLLIGKTEAGKLEYQPAWLDLAQFCSDLVEEMQISTNTHAIVFRTHDLYPSVYIDEKLLRLILSNLLSNALKYSPKGGTVYLDLVCEQAEAIFHIQDEGIGIPAADGDKLFDSFYRGSNVGTISGTGLGLAIVKRSIDLLAGKIMVKSEVGVGTTFTVMVPISNQTSGLARTVNG
jgi:signal transduction histidine kinase